MTKLDYLYYRYFSNKTPLFKKLNIKRNVFYFPKWPFVFVLVGLSFGSSVTPHPYTGTYPSTTPAIPSVNPTNPRNASEPTTPLPTAPTAEPEATPETTELIPNSTVQRIAETTPANITIA